MKPHIYKITNLINGKIYIGQHNGSKNHYFAGGTYINKSIKKYGKNNFKREVIIEGDFTTEELDVLEVKYIQENKSYYYDYPDKGYNLTRGGGVISGGRHPHSDKTKELLLKNSATRKSVIQLNMNGDFVNLFLSIKDASKKTGVLRTSILRCCQDKSIENKSAGGFIWMYESSYKIKNYKIRKPDYYKKVNQYTLSGEFVDRYVSIKEAAKSVGVSATAISNMLKGITKKAGGFIWKFSID